MKKKVLIVATVMASLASFAQTADSGSGEELKGRKGQPILPKGGDIALGFNAVPMFDWMLVTVSRNANNTTPTTQNAAQFTNNSNNQIVGKYYLDATTAVRVRLGINNIAGSITNRVQNAAVFADALNGTLDDQNAARLFQVEDKMNFRKSNVQVAIGYEKRRGYGRLQGFYGAEIGFGRQSSSANFSYGNNFSDRWAVEYTNNWNGNPTTATQNPSPGVGVRATRVLEAKYQTGMRYGARLFVGAEYFILPKISVGAEFGWGYSITTNGAQKVKNEVYIVGQNGPTVLIEEENMVNSTSTRGWSVDNNTNQAFSMNTNANNTANVAQNNNNFALNNGVSGGSAAIILLIHF